MTPEARSTLNASCGWTVATWLVFTLFVEDWTHGLVTMTGAVFTIMVWAILTRYLGDRS